MSDKKIVAVSGGFDPIHVGHIRMIQAASLLGDELVVIMNNDHWLRKKKRYVFMPQEQRKEIIEAISGVDRVMMTNHMEDCDDMSVCSSLDLLRPHIFANGGDRFADNIPEAILCRERAIETVFHIGRGGKVQSSSWLTAEDRDKRACFCESDVKYVDCHGQMSI